ncbi:glycosyltransferase [soil metagenome]
MTARLSVVMPAHNESAIIAATLGRIIGADPTGEIEVVVVANGCTDETARVAASVSPRIRVVEIAEPSKIAALNAGDAEALAFPRAYVDADVRVDVATLLALADALDNAPGARVASPRLVVDTTGSTWFARQYFRVWALSDYRASNHIGSGIYALSRAARNRFGDFPDVIADDRFVQQSFAPDERLTLAEHSFEVRAPRTLRAQISRSTRIQVGNRQLERSGLALDAGTESRNHSAIVRRVVRQPTLWPAFVVYSVGYLAARSAARRLIARGAATAWNRDESSRV